MSKKRETNPNLGNGNKNIRSENTKLPTYEGKPPTPPRTNDSKND